MPIVYKTTNIINGKMYIGVDSKNNPYYLGSGKLLKIALEKYGPENFQKETLAEFSNVEEAYMYEKALIESLDAVNSNSYYNVMDGGKGGWNHIDVKGQNNPMYGKSVKDAMIEKYGEEIGNDMYRESRLRAGAKTSAVLSGVPKTEEHKKNLSNAKKEFWNNLTEDEKIERRKAMSVSMKSANIVRTEEYKEKMSKSLKEKSTQIHQKYTCIHCKKEMNRTNLKRWHGENCKQRTKNS